MGRRGYPCEKPAMPQGGRLTALDSTFLHLEKGGAHMHVASIFVFEGDAPPYDEVRDAIEARMHLVPRYRQRLAEVPYGQGRPVWVDDPHFNIGYHVRHTALPAPGSDEVLKRLAGRLFAQPLDRQKPLWEIWLVEGLQAGGRQGGSSRPPARSAGRCCARPTTRWSTASRASTSPRCCSTPRPTRLRRRPRSG